MLYLKSGETVQGVYLGGDTRELKFVGPDGTKSYPIGEVNQLVLGDD